jgi:2-polyprenyl-3-methyl-5-hydroxy-6-metoxy-1,4-benzoquinol methylase
MSTNEKHIVGETFDLGAGAEGKDVINFADHKIAYITKRCAGKDVLDLGCVQHTTTAYLSKNWLHKAIIKVAKSTKGLDLYSDGVKALQAQGYDVVYGDAQDFNIGQKYDVVVAGDLIEHLSNFDGFFNSINRHLKDDGVLLIATPNPWHWVRCVRSAMGQRIIVNPEHTAWFCPDTVRLIGKRFGLEVVDVGYGSERFKDSFVPFPETFRHQSFFATLRKAG